jgi:2-hydroxy-3-keto-5-methylthiopentenyl-1-phosphate phosphatase
MNAEAVPVPALESGDPPIAFLVDYDGTIALTDVSDRIMAEFVTEEWERKAAEYDAGFIGSRRLMEWEVGLIRADPDALRAVAASQPHDPSFRPFVERARAARIPVEVVSDGFGFFIPAALASLGLGDLPVVTADTVFRDGRATIRFPNGHPTCFVCGTCKRNRVLAHQAAGRAVVFIGDGPSDRYGAAHADVVFAKHALVNIAVEEGWPFERWTEFSEIQAWLERRLARWPGDPSAFPVPAGRPLACGPELWGEGRWDPPPPGDPYRGIAAVQDEGLAPG